MKYEVELEATFNANAVVIVEAETYKAAVRTAIQLAKEDQIDWDAMALDKNTIAAVTVDKVKEDGQ